MQIYTKAVEYATNGLSIHLLKPLEKRPVENGWSTAPFLKPEDMFEEFKSVQDANIGVRLGEATKIGSRYLYVLDLDISAEDPTSIKEAYDKLKSIYKDYDKLPIVKSASKNSRHFYFLSKILLKTKKLGHSAGKVTVQVNGQDKVKNAWEIDLCSTGKQVVIPPSVFNGNTYKWDRDLLDYLNDDTKKALMIIDDMNLMTLDLENDPQSDKGSTVKKSYKVNEISKYLNKLPSEFYDDHNEWIKVGMALHNEFSDTDDEQEAIQLFDEFSKKSEKYEKGGAFKKWRTFTKSEDGITLGTIFYHCPEETSEDKILQFSKFLNEEVLNFKNLKNKLAECDLKDYELEGFIDLIASGLTAGMKQKYSSTNTRKLLNSLRKEIKEEEEEELEELSIGLDDTLGEMILKEHFNDGKYLLNLKGNLFTYKHGVWVREDIEIIEKLVLNGIKKIMKSTSKDYAAIKKVIYKKSKNHDMDGLTNKIVSIILKMVATSEADDILNLKNKSEINYSVVNTLNKELYIQNGKMTVEDHKYDSYLITQFNVNYDEKADCPTWDLVLNNVFQKYADKEDVKRHFCEVLGYIMQSKKKSPLFLILLGSGRNGKSKIMEEFSLMMGVDSTVNEDLLSWSKDTHGISDLVGKNMFFDDDWKKNQILPDDIIKKMSENKLLTANPKFEKRFNFVSKCTPVISANNNAKTVDTSFGMERRAHVFDFNYTFTLGEIDHHLGEKLKAERSGFLNLLIKSYLAYENRGSFKYPLSVQKSIKNWLKGSNPLHSFFDEKTVITKDHTDRVKAQQLYDLYIMYMQNENFSHNMTRSNFYSELTFMDGLTKKLDGTDKNYYIHGLKLNKNIF